MKIGENVTNVVANNVFSGYYKKIHDRGVKGKLFNFSSPSYSFLNFHSPYDAYLKQFDENHEFKVVGAGEKIRNATDGPSSDRTGALYYSERAELFGLCHGFGHDNLTYYNGYNYYNAFYPAGYFSPPFGENLSIFRANLDGIDNLTNGSCGQLSITDYNELFGIVSKSSLDAGMTSTTLTANIYAPIYTPKEACPPEIAITSYFDEINFTQIPGTTAALGANALFNGNPIPTSLDSFDIKVNTRYALSADEDGINSVLFANGRPIPSYSASNQTNKLNNALCLANIMENGVSFGRGTNGLQLIEAPDLLWGAIGEQVSFAGADPWHYWHFTFRENAASLPFYNNFIPIDQSKSSSMRTLSQGTQLFLPTLSSEDSYWQNRQCPDTVDFLPWTLGASIYACPSEHFDIPYYAAIKKFGFYGARFLNSCRQLSLTYPLSGVDNATELPESSSPYPIGPELEPGGIDDAGVWSFSSYDNLLRTAKAEERYSNMYALNKGFFLWANSGYLVTDPQYTKLKNYRGFEPLILSFLQKFQLIFSSGLSSFSGSEPQVLIREGLTSTQFTVFDSGLGSDLLFTNDAYTEFKKQLVSVMSGTGIANWSDLENKYSYYISDGDGINESFYSSVVSGREKRLRTRYFENIVRGNPIDLYPLNHIAFSFDKAKDYLESKAWGRSISSFGKGSDLPEVEKRFFEGAYGNASSITGLVDVLNTLSFSQDTFFYPGFFNDVRFNKTSAKPSYSPALSGRILDTAGRSYSPSGWLAIGYNEIGSLDKNFSCFTPIFVQSPLPKVVCKVGQKPIFRAYAVDYHSIPEDKMSQKYPEIAYWCEKLKLFSPNKRNLYPLKYKWHRVLKSEYSSFLASGDFSKADTSNPTGEWCALEGDTRNCTLIHPLECSPIYNTGHLNETHYTFLKGAKKGIDDQYYYFCLASGRFGVRISNPAELAIEDWIRFDISLKNATNSSQSVNIDFEVTDYNGSTETISFEQDSSSDYPNYCGFEMDVTAIPESVVEQKIPPPNAGWGDVTAYRFIGPIGYVGSTRSYKPSTLKDNRGLREIWGHLLDYGMLVPFSKTLSQHQGDLLYGYSHLPICDNYSMAPGKKGIKVLARLGDFKIGHWTLSQKAVASLDMTVGVKWDKLTNVGELYPPVNYFSDIETPHLGIGQWQWGNNLGAIKRFGANSNSRTNDIQFVGGGAPPNGAAADDLTNQIKKKLVLPDTLAGENCGYTKYALGRNMLYFVEAFERFYIICDAVKKKNVRNVSFLCPGLRQANSATQYFWLGKPHNTYLERRAMYGPYAYQWKVKRHNRDRNGNGASEAFYSMGWSQRYELLYDAPAVYGLYVRKEVGADWKSLTTRVQTARDAAGIFDLPSLRGVWFGKGGGEGGARPYGNIFYSCESGAAHYNEVICNYVELAGELASRPDVNSYSCPDKSLQEGACFDPCMSMRYAQGFPPGGKSQDFFAYNTTTSRNLPERKRVKLVPLANRENNSLISRDEQSTVDGDIYFRSPVNTPHARISRGLAGIQGDFVSEIQEIVGMTPCQDGGSDHCNYMTPTIHLGANGMSSILLGDTTAFNDAQNYVGNFYSDINIRGEVD